MEKSVTISSDSLKLSKTPRKNKEGKKTQKHKPEYGEIKHNKSNENKLKRELIKRIKNKRKSQSQSQSQSSDNINNPIKHIQISSERQDEFQKSLTELNTILSERRQKLHKTKRRRNKTPIHTSSFSDAVIENDKTMGDVYKPQPSYSNLKFGSKNTYREQNKTKRKPNIQFNDSIDSISISTIDDRLQNISKPVYTPTSIPTSKPPSKLLQIENSIDNKIKNDTKTDIDNTIKNEMLETKKSKSKTRRNDTNTNTNISNQKTIIKKTCRVGKHNNKVSVFLKKDDDKEQLNRKISDIYDIPIYEMKKYLCDNKLLQPSSDCPYYIIREMYKNAILSGNIKNNGKSSIQPLLQEIEDKGYI